MLSRKSYFSTIILILAMMIGVAIGLIFGEKASALNPLGDLFLNLLLVIIPPLIFLTISTSIAKITTPKRLGKILFTIFIILLITSVIAALYGILVTYPLQLVSPNNVDTFTQDYHHTEEQETSSFSILSEFVSLISVSDFNALLTRQNIVAIAVFSILFGLAIKQCKEKALPLLTILDATVDVIMAYLNIVFYYAPIGIGCYLAALVGSYGSTIAIGYLKTFILYFIASIIFYFAVYTIYAFIAGGKKAVHRFWHNILPVSLTALATCSSAASIPANIITAKRIGVSDDIAEPFIPLATTFHKDGSIIGSVFKIMFLVCLFGIKISFWKVLGIALLASLFVTAIPIGGGVISETLILVLLGCPISALQSLTIIATIIDAPATVLNVVGDTSATMLSARLIDGKDWLNQINLKDSY